MKMECQAEKIKHFQHLLLFAFSQDFAATKSPHDICNYMKRLHLLKEPLMSGMQRLREEISTSKTPLVLAVQLFSMNSG